MPRRLFALFALLFVASFAMAEPPADADVLAKAQVPKLACDAVIVKQKALNGVVLPLPRLGFVRVPVEVWRCDVWVRPVGGPAGAARVRMVVHLLTVAE